MTFDEQYPEFEKANGMPFASLKTKTKTNLLAEWAARGDIDRLENALDDIDFRANLDVLGGINFSQWMLSHQEERVFNFWRTMTAGKKTEKNAAALVMLINKPERLKVLDRVEWEETINCKLNTFSFMVDEDSTYHPSVPENIKNGKDLADMLVRKNNVDAVTLLAYYGHSDLFAKYYKKRNDEISKNVNQETTLALARSMLIVKEDLLPFEKVLNLLKTNVDYFGHKERSVLLRAINSNSTKRIGEYFTSLSPSQVRDSLSSGWAVEKVLERLFKNGKRKTIEYLLTSTEGEPARESIKKAMGFKLLTKIIERGDLNDLKTFHKLNPEVFEEKDWVYHTSKGRKKGNALTFAMKYGQDDMVKFLVEEGLDLKPSIELCEYMPYVKENNENYQMVKSFVDKYRIYKKLNKKEEVVPPTISTKRRAL